MRRSSTRRTKTSRAPTPSPTRAATEPPKQIRRRVTIQVGQEGAGDNKAAEDLQHQGLEQALAARQEAGEHLARSRRHHDLVPPQREGADDPHLPAQGASARAASRNSSARESSASLAKAGKNKVRFQGLLDEVEEAVAGHLPRRGQRPRRCRQPVEAQRTHLHNRARLGTPNLERTRYAEVEDAPDDDGPERGPGVAAPAGRLSGRDDLRQPAEKRTDRKHVRHAWHLHDRLLHPFDRTEWGPDLGGSAGGRGHNEIPLSRLRRGRTGADHLPASRTSSLPNPEDKDNALATAAGTGPTVTVQPTESPETPINEVGGQGAGQERASTSPSTSPNPSASSTTATATSAATSSRRRSSKAPASGAPPRRPTNCRSRRRSSPTPTATGSATRPRTSARARSRRRAPATTRSPG